MAQKKKPFKGYKCIEVWTYDPSGLKPSEKTLGPRARRFFYYCNNCENCEALCNGQCFQKNIPLGQKCPYGKVDRKESWNGEETEVERFLFKTLKGHKSHSKETLDPIEELCSVGDYVYLPLNFLENYTNSIADELGIISGHFIHKDNFTVENVAKLIAYRPVSLSGGVIESYLKEDVPHFVSQLKVYDAELFNSIINLFPNLADIIEDIDYRDKRAFVTTLNPGRVLINNTRFEWTGEYLTTNASELIPNLKHKEELRIYPNEDTVVIIDDNDTVNLDTTKFV